MADWHRSSDHIKSSQEMEPRASYGHNGRITTTGCQGLNVHLLWSQNDETPNFAVGRELSCRRRTWRCSLWSYTVTDNVILVCNFSTSVLSSNQAFIRSSANYIRKTIEISTQRIANNTNSFLSQHAMIGNSRCIFLGGMRNGNQQNSA